MVVSESDRRAAARIVTLWRDTRRLAEGGEVGELAQGNPDLVRLTLWNFEEHGKSTGEVLEALLARIIAEERAREITPPVPGP